jgi:hypothetical protein
MSGADEEGAPNVDGLHVCFLHACLLQRQSDFQPSFPGIELNFVTLQKLNIPYRRYCMRING